ncbi:MAG: DNA methyltransferase, partial [Thermomicrobiales bacterium]
RGGWNRPAAEGYGLPTETWREYMARRERYDEIGGKLLAGEVTSIDDLITYNLDIRQFAQDVIQHADGPELVRAFFKAIRDISVLDPTCGSGAFLFAALNILFPLYDACLERMEEFVDALERNPEPQHPQKYSDFKDVLAEMGGHSNRDYAIFKAIIARNLYGVDIMEEAVETCKLRLFLKLASKLEQDQPIEPLPDIDFNIRAGNTLVGFTSMEDLRRAAYGTSTGQQRMVDAETERVLGRIAEQAELADRAFQQFRLQQTSLGGQVSADDKQALRERLYDLSTELDRYLARLYAIDRDNIRDAHAYEEAFTDWRDRHKPFHWLIDFYGIMQRGGFDVIIGNPPYLERSKLKNQYAVINYATESCRDIYAWVVERCFRLRARDSALGLIIPVS